MRPLTSRVKTPFSEYLVRSTNSGSLGQNRISANIRSQIVFNHLFFCDLSNEEKSSLLHEDFYLQIIDHQNFSPRLIDLLTTADYLTLQDMPIRDVALKILDNPAALWETPYRAHLTDDSRTIMLALCFSGHYTSVDKLIQNFKNFINCSGPQISDSGIIVRFRHALKPLEGSIASLSNGNIYFSNPGIKDFLSSVILEDCLLDLALRAAQTLEVLNSVWEFYRKHCKTNKTQMPAINLWSTALKRIMGMKPRSIIRMINLALEMCNHIQDNEDLIAFIEQSLRQLQSGEVDGSDEMYFRHALERFQDLSSEQQEAIPSRGMLVEVAADMLSFCGDQLSLEEIEELAHTIAVYGESPNIANFSAGKALSGFLIELSDKLWEISSISELDEFEYKLTKLVKRYDVDFDLRFETKIIERRDYLELKETHKPEELYTSIIKNNKDSDISDASIQSLFEILIENKQRPKYR